MVCSAVSLFSEAVTQSRDNSARVRDLTPPPTPPLHSWCLFQAWDQTDLTKVKESRLLVTLLENISWLHLVPFTGTGQGTSHYLSMAHPGLTAPPCLWMPIPKDPCCHLGTSCAGYMGRVSSAFGTEQPPCLFVPAPHTS